MSLPTQRDSRGSCGSKKRRDSALLHAEKKRRLDLEKDFNDIEDKRHERVRSIKDLAGEFEEGYRLRNPKSSTFVEYALGHVKGFLDAASTVDITDATVKNYQTSRLKEKASEVHQRRSGVATSHSGRAWGLSPGEAQAGTR